MQPARRIKCVVYVPTSISEMCCVFVYVCGSQLQMANSNYKYQRMNKSLYKSKTGTQYLQLSHVVIVSHGLHQATKFSRKVANSKFQFQIYSFFDIHYYWMTENKHLQLQITPTFLPSPSNLQCLCIPVTNSTLTTESSMQYQKKNNIVQLETVEDKTFKNCKTTKHFKNQLKLALLSRYD